MHPYLFADYIEVLCSIAVLQHCSIAILCSIVQFVPYCSILQFAANCIVAVLWSALLSVPSADCTHLPGSKEGGGDLWWRKDVQDNDEDVDDDLDGDDLDGGDLDGGIYSSYLMQCSYLWWREDVPEQ